MPKLDYLAPGVYIEEVQRGSRPIEGVQTAIAGFVGFTEDVRGGAELFKPMLVTSWSQYIACFGRSLSDGFTDYDAYLPYAVYGWFLNGGGRCWVMSIGTQLPCKTNQNSAPTVLTSQSAIAPPGGTVIPSRSRRPSLHIRLRSHAATQLMHHQAQNPGEASVRIESHPNQPVERHPPGNGRLETTQMAIANASLSIVIRDSRPKDAAPEDTIDTGEFFALHVYRGTQALEQFDHLSMQSDVDKAVANYVVTALERSRFIEAIHLEPGQGRSLSRRPSNGTYPVSLKSSVPDAKQFPRQMHGSRDDRSGIRGLFEIDEITIVACPDLMKAYEQQLLTLDQVHGLMDLMMSLCEGAADGDVPNPPNRMVILDPPPDRGKPQDTPQW
jgi:hypothetical protein